MATAADTYFDQGALPLEVFCFIRRRRVQLLGASWFVRSLRIFHPEQKSDGF